MNAAYNIYCDESRHDGNPEQRYMIIGGLWCPRPFRNNLFKEIRNVKMKHETYGEFKWNKVSNSKIEAYKDLVSIFFDHKELRFRCIVVDREICDLATYHGDDEELAFYRFYYEMLEKWILPGSTYYVKLDQKQNSDMQRIPKLKEVLSNYAEIRGISISSLSECNSKIVLPIQLVDLLIGAIGYQYNDFHKKVHKNAKTELCSYITTRLGKRDLIYSTALSENKFNIFKISFEK